MVISPDVKDHILGAMVCLLFTDHSAISLIRPITAHPKISDGLSEMSGQILLPSLAVTYLVALREAVAVGVDPAWLVHISVRSARPIGPCRRDGGTLMDSVLGHVTA